MKVIEYTNTIGNCQTMRLAFYNESFITDEEAQSYVSEKEKYSSYILYVDKDVFINVLGDYFSIKIGEAR